MVAPGDFIQSAWSGDPSLTLKALLEGKEWKGAPTCAVHQMSGTSMATPVTGKLISELYSNLMFRSATSWIIFEAFLYF